MHETDTSDVRAADSDTDRDSAPTARPEPRTGAARVTPEWSVPDDADPVRCPYCDRPFRTPHDRALHVGEAHPDDCTETEREAYQTADEEEVDQLFFYHMKVVVMIGLLYSVVVLLYMAVLGLSG